MDFVQAVSVCVQKKYVDFSGRASRSEFWWFVLFNIIASIVGSILGAMIHPAISFLVSLGLLLPALGVSVRRLHDVGRSGWWLLLSFVPLVGFLVLLYWDVQPGEPGANAWGEPPLTGPLATAAVPPGAV